MSFEAPEEGWRGCTVSRLIGDHLWRRPWSMRFLLLRVVPHGRGGKNTPKQAEQRRLCYPKQPGVVQTSTWGRLNNSSAGKPQNREEPTYKDRILLCFCIWGTKKRSSTHVQRWRRELRGLLRSLSKATWMSENLIQVQCLPSLKFSKTFSLCPGINHGRIVSLMGCLLILFRNLVPFVTLERDKYRWASFLSKESKTSVLLHFRFVSCRPYGEILYNIIHTSGAPHGSYWTYPPPISLHQRHPDAASGICEVTSCPLQHQFRPPHRHPHLLHHWHVQLWPCEEGGRDRRHV